MTDDTPTDCRPTVARIQAYLDGDLPAAALSGDGHADGCVTCRGRVRAARALRSVLTAPVEPVFASSSLTDAILAGVRADRRARVRRRVFAVAGCGALAAAVLLMAWSPWRTAGSVEVVGQPRPAVPEVRPTPAPVPPVRIGDELAKAGDALRESTEAVAAPVAAVPKLFAALTDSVAAPPRAVSPLEPARASLADLPVAARAGLEPVTGSAKKAWNRLLRDVGAVSSKPTS